MVITRIRLKNWRNFRNVDVSLLDTTYILGPNASGRSNFLDVFRFLRDIATPQGGGVRNALELRGGFSKVRCLAARQKPNIVIEVELSNDFDVDTPLWRYYLEIGQQSRGLFLPQVIKEEVYSCMENRYVLQRPDAEDKADPQLLTQTALEQIAMNGSFREIAEFFSRTLYLHLVPQLLKYGSELAVKKMTNDPFGQGFLDKIAHAPEKIRASRLRRIEGLLKGAIQGFSDLRFEMDKGGQPHLQMRYLHWRPNGGFQTEEEFSDGTLRLIGLLWTLLENGSLILLEEPELSLNSAIVKHIPEMIQRARDSRKKGDCGQMLVSTHSDVLLSSPVIRGQYLTIAPSDVKGKGSVMSGPTENDRKALAAGLSPADILLPKTAYVQGNLFETW